ncbi:MAG: hypothetical protein IKM50_05805 [Tidjanibacter sp.]|nr:hypothetical protein [Tidjanibacter sp.]MBR6814042.1 hypothetical protein [Tidjanibacter sp.]
MKRVLLVIIGCLIACTSCIGSFSKEIDGGFPDKIILSKEGGEFSYVGEVPIFSITIYDGVLFLDDSKNDSFIDTNGLKDSITVKYDWLTASTYKEARNTLKLFAEPNTSNRSRRSTIYLNETAGYEYICIEIKQQD